MDLLKISDIAKAVLDERYYLEGEDWDKLSLRVATYIADDNQEQEAFYEMIGSGDFIPNSPCLMNAGARTKQMAACFLFEIDDTMDSIMDVAKQSAMVYKSGGGVGFYLGNLRPAGDRVGTTGGVASGPVSFLRIYDTVSDVIKQGGLRRSANMGLLDVSHPDIFGFLEAKSDLTRFSNFNLSVSITDEFMNAALNGLDFDLRYKGRVYKTIKAADLFAKICHNAWAVAEPGVVFIDEINRHNMTPWLGRLKGVNACAEAPLYHGESCVLGSINLANFITVDRQIDYEGLKTVAENAVKFLDNLITKNVYPSDEITTNTLKTRKIGIGVMGLADAFYMLGIPYNSPEALTLTHSFMGWINTAAQAYSFHLGQKLGFFPSCCGDNMRFLRRNAVVTTVAPTGSISILANVSSGIEPNFSLAYERNILGKKFIHINSVFENFCNYVGLDPHDYLDAIFTTGSLKDTNIPKPFKDTFVTAREIDWQTHVAIQAAAQKHVENAISKTINMPEDATVEDVSAAIVSAYQLKCKGITVYRDNCRANQPMSVPKCDTCGSPLVMEEGCMKCPKCLVSKCSLG